MIKLRDLTDMYSSAYDLLAEEFYDSNHITSRNFDSATHNFLNNWSNPIPQTGLVLEAGAGRGSAGRYCSILPERVIQTDISFKMLSLPDREKCQQRITSNATAHPFRTSIFACVLAFLCDPFNLLEFYCESYRLLQTGGVLIATFPHIKWGSMLRSIRGYPSDTTRFVTHKGMIIESKSYLLSDSEIQANVANSGMRLLGSFDLCLPHNIDLISPDIELPSQSLNVSPYKLPIVKLVCARKS